MRARISYLIKWVERGLKTELDTALRPLGVTTPEYTAMSVLKRRSGLSSAQLARRAFVSAQAMNQIVVSLEQQGWIERSADPQHGRILRAQLTREGRRTLAACERATVHIERSLLAGLSAEEVDALRRVLETCANSLADPQPAQEREARTGAKNNPSARSRG
jgi:DNA-binding MarR family transcriptional regulator